MPYTQDELDEFKAEERRDRAVLDFVLSIVSASDKEAIEYELSESGYCHSFLIVDLPRGSCEEDGQPFEHGHLHVNQTTNGGYSGDEFAGTVSIPIGGGKWLQFSYSM